MHIGFSVFLYSVYLLVCDLLCAFCMSGCRSVRFRGVTPYYRIPSSSMFFSEGFYTFARYVACWVFYLHCVLSQYGQFTRPCLSVFGQVGDISVSRRVVPKCSLLAVKDRFLSRFLRMFQLLRGPPFLPGRPN